jgi:steroid 5-alpha reductase family enzyme
MGLGINEPTNSRIVTTIFMFVFGTFMMVVSDAQKFFTLKNKPGLISEGMFKITRNPNYFGELMIYFSFAACTGNLISYAILLLV